MSYVFWRKPFFRIFKGKLVFWAPKDPLLSTLHVDPWKKIVFWTCLLYITPCSSPTVQMYVNTAASRNSKSVFLLPIGGEYLLFTSNHKAEKVGQRHMHRPHVEYGWSLYMTLCNYTQINCCKKLVKYNWNCLKDEYFTENNLFRINWGQK